MTTTKSLRHSASRAIATASIIGAVSAGIAAASPASALPAGASGSAGSATAPYCGLTWGSTPETAGSLVPDPLRAVRAGRNTCYDRLVLDLGPTPAGYDVSYVTTVYAEGSGNPVPVAGGARLAIHLKAPAGFVPANRARVVDVTGYSTFRQVAWGGSFEGYTTIALGVRARLPFRVFTIDDGATSRMVVDVAHYW